MQTIYFDNAATTSISQEVIQVMTENMQQTFGNPSSTHQFGRKAKALLEQSRKTIAKILNCSANEIIFTAGGTEADNLILRNAVTNLNVKRIITSKIEHHAVLHTVKALQKEYNTQIDFVKLDEHGQIDYHALEMLLQNKTHKTLVSLMWVNNEIGNILDLEKVIEICKKNDALFHSDTVQGIAHLQLDLQKHPIDFIAASAHKFHGPKGVGFAVLKKHFGIKPLIIGGEQEHGARAGTENTHSILGMTRALQIATQALAKDANYISNLKQNFIEQLQNKIAPIAFNGLSNKLDKSAYHILNVRFPKEFAMLLFNLDLKGIAASGGSACQSGSNKGSHVLEAILSEKDAKNTSVRFSFSKYNTQQEIDVVINALQEITAEKK